jgi:hypothetical protein
MSLRYAQVTPQKLKGDYLKAIAAIEGQVALPELASASPELVVAGALDEALARLGGKLRAGHPEKKQLAALIRRIDASAHSFASSTDADSLLRSSTRFLSSKGRLTLESFDDPPLYAPDASPPERTSEARRKSAGSRRAPLVHKWYTGRILRVL